LGIFCELKLTSAGTLLSREKIAKAERTRDFDDMVGARQFCGVLLEKYEESFHLAKPARQDEVKKKYGESCIRILYLHGHESAVFVMAGGTISRKESIEKWRGIYQDERLKRGSR